MFDVYNIFIAMGLPCTQYKGNEKLSNIWQDSMPLIFIRDFIFKKTLFEKLQVER